MSHRPFPNVDRALAQVRRQQAVYQYGRFPQRYALSMDAWQPDFLMDGSSGDVVPFPVDEYRLSSRPRIVGGGR